MKQIVSRWLLPIVLAVGMCAPALAGGDKDEYHQRHHRGNGGDPTAGIAKSFGDFFLSSRKIGDEFDKAFTFTVTSASSFSAIILSSGIEDFVGSLIGRTDPFLKSFNIEDGKTSFSALIGPGKYSFVLLGTVAEAPALYAGTFQAVAVPEPAEWMMIMAGVAMMGFVVSRRRNG